MKLNRAQKNRTGFLPACSSTLLKYVSQQYTPPILPKSSLFCSSYTWFALYLSARSPLSFRPPNLSNRKRTMIPDRTVQLR